MNCVNCNKGFSCGCQKMTVDGVVIHKTCQNEWNNKKLSNQGEQTPKQDLSLQLAADQIKNLRNK
jgi:hypothetical protein